MPRNLLLNPNTAQKIDAQVAKVLNDLGNPEPPLRLEEACELLRLDRGYYSSTNEGWLQEKIHKLTLAGKQIVARPSLLLDVVRKMSLKALVLPDRKRLLIDAELPPPKQRWSEAHEIAHTIIPWHEGISFGDQDKTLKPSCHELVESEANYGAGRLIFIGNRFGEELLAGPVTFDRIRKMSKTYGNSMTTTLWRAVEHLDIPAVGIVSQHPSSPEADEPVRYLIRSHRFEQHFSHLTEAALFRFLASYCTGRRGPLGRTEASVADSNGDEHEFFFETFYNGYEALTLGLHRAARPATVSMSIAAH